MNRMTAGSCLCLLLLLCMQAGLSLAAGVQVSSEDGDIDWNTVRRKNLPNVAFAFIRGSDGDLLDPRFKSNFENARKYDIFQTKYVHVFRTEVPDNSSVTGTRKVSVADQLKTIEKAMNLVNFDNKGHQNRMTDELVIRVQKVSGDAGMSGSLGKRELFTRVDELVQALNHLGIEPVIQTDKGFWDEYMYSGSPLTGKYRTLMLDKTEPQERITGVPLAVCELAIQRFAPHVNATDAEYLPLGLKVYQSEGEKNGFYYWHFSDNQKVNGIEGPVSLVTVVHPSQALQRYWWDEVGAGKPYPSYPIPVNFKGDHWRRGVPYDAYSSRCHPNYADLLGILPDLVDLPDEE